RRAWAPARTRRPSSRVFEVYVRIFKARGKSRPLRGLTFLASASRSRRASNGHSFDVSFARSGQAVAFTSLATNLSAGDRHRRSDVYERTFARVHGSLQPRTKLVS